MISRSWPLTVIESQTFLHHAFKENNANNASKRPTAFFKKVVIEFKLKRIGRNYIVKNPKNFLNTMQKFRLKIPFRDQKIFKNQNNFTGLWRQWPYWLKIHLTWHGYRQYRSYTNFDIKLDGFIRILVWTFD